MVPNIDRPRSLTAGAGTCGDQRPRSGRRTAVGLHPAQGRRLPEVWLLDLLRGPRRGYRISSGRQQTSRPVTPKCIRSVGPPVQPSSHLPWRSDASHALLVPSAPDKCVPGPARAGLSPVRLRLRTIASALRLSRTASPACPARTATRVRQVVLRMRGGCKRVNDGLTGLPLCCASRLGARLQASRWHITREWLRMREVSGGVGSDAGQNRCRGPRRAAGGARGGGVSRHVTGQTLRRSGRPACRYSGREGRHVRQAPGGMPEDHGTGPSHFCP